MPKILPSDHSQHRRKLFGRVEPRTLEYLQSLDEPNLGRAVDHAVSMLIRRARRMTAPQPQISPPQMS